MTSPDVAEPPRPRFGSAAWVAGVVLAYAAFVLVRLALHGFDPAVFVLAGELLTDPAQLPPEVSARPGAGYDGQFFYRLALAPFDTAEYVHGIRFDSPVYRAQRLVYPLLVGAVSWGSPRAALWGMIAVNLAALGALTWIGTRYARALGLAPVWGLAFVLYPGLLLTLARDTSEIVALTFLLGGLLALRLDRAAPAVVLLTLAAFTRETSLLACVGIFLAWARVRLPARVWFRPLAGASPAAPPALAWLVPAAVYLLWLAAVCWNWDRPPFQNTGNNFAFPGVALLRFWASVLPPQRPLDFIHLAELIYLGCLGGFAFGALRRTSAWIHERAALGLYALLAVSASSSIWVEDWSYLRVLAEFHALAVVVVLGAPRASFVGRVRGLLFLAMGVIWLGLWLHRTQLTALILKGEVAP